MATGLSASVLHAGDFEYDYPCTECQEHGLNSEAVYFCQQCTRQFCGLCIKQHGRFYRKHLILGTEKMDSWKKVKSTCKLHPGEEMKVFCNDHGQTCCFTCQKELHRQCKQVILLQHKTPKPSNRPVSEKSGNSTVTKNSDQMLLKRKEKVRTGEHDNLQLKSKEKVGSSEHGQPQLVSDIDPNRQYKVMETKRFNVELACDVRPCRILGITVLPGGDIILIDNWNRKVKLLSADYAVVDYVTISVGPWGICAVSDNQVAVCFGNSVIHFFQCQQQQAENGEKILNICCTYLSYTAGNLYVASGKIVYQFTLAGQRVRKIYTIDGKYVRDFAVSPDGDSLYITDIDDHQLVTVNMQGQVLAIQNDEDLLGPTGVCVSPDGHVFVCGIYSHTILQVDSEGKHKLAILATEKDRVLFPLSACFDIRTSSLLVGMKDANLIILKLK